jgi:hypothetical protein
MPLLNFLIDLNIRYRFFSKMNINGVELKQGDIISFEYKEKPDEEKNPPPFNPSFGFNFSGFVQDITGPSGLEVLVTSPTKKIIPEDDSLYGYLIKARDWIELKLTPFHGDYRPYHFPISNIFDLRILERTKRISYFSDLRTWNPILVELGENTFVGYPKQEKKQFDLYSIASDLPYACWGPSLAERALFYESRVNFEKKSVKVYGLISTS